MNINDRERITQLLQNGHYIAKKKRPFTDFESQNSLDKAKGLDIQDRYNNDRYAVVLIRAIAVSRICRSCFTC